MVQVMISAGEPSGDRHAAGLAKTLRQYLPEVELWGMGGESLREAGVDLKVRIGSISVVGITEAMGQLMSVWRARRELLRNAMERRPKAAILVDYPEFHLWLARGLKKMGIPIFYYISPQVWAWRKGRLRLMRRILDRVAVILPFEEEILRSHGIDATYVGHPIKEQIQKEGSRKKARDSLGLHQDSTVVGLLPGSRPKEVHHILPAMLEGVELASTHIKGMIPVVALSPLVDRSSIDTLVRKSHLEVMVISGSAHKVIEASDAVVVASGTATLEAALMEIPMIVVYKTSWLSYMLARMLVKVRHVSLVNILAGQPIVPELLQGRMSASNIAMHLKEILREGHVRRKMIEDLRNIHHMLGDQRASQEAAKLALDLIMG